MANTGFLRILSPGYLADSSSLVQFRMCSALNASHEYELKLLCRDQLAWHQLIASSLKWCCGESSFEGVVKSLKRRSCQNGAVELRIILDTSLLAMKGTTRSRVVTQSNLIQVLNSLFSSYPTLVYKTEISSKNNIFKEAWLQFKETDFQFLTRILADQNCDFYVDRESVVVIRDSVQLLPMPCNAISLSDIQCSFDGLSYSLNYSSHDLYWVGDRISYHELDFIIEHSEITAHEAKVQHSAQQSNNDFVCRVWARTKQAHTPLRRSLCMGLQRVKQVNFAEFEQAEIGIASQFCWDLVNPYSLMADLMQLWVGNDKGLQFVPRLGSNAVVFKTAESNENFLITNMFSHDVESESKAIKIKNSLISFADDLKISAEASELKNIAGAYKCLVGRNLRVKLIEKLLIKLDKASAILKAQTIELKVNSSRVTLSSSGLSIKASKIEFITPSGRSATLARIGDQHLCPLVNPDLSPHFGGVINEGASKLKINGLKAGRFRDQLNCNGPLDVISEGVPDLLIEGQAAGFLGAQTFHGGCITSASPNVISVASNLAVHESQVDKPKLSSESWVQLIEV